MTNNYIESEKTTNFLRQLEQLVGTPKMEEIKKCMVEQKVFLVDDDYINNWKSSLDKVKSERDEFLSTSLYAYRFLAPFIEKFASLTEEEIAKTKNSAAIIATALKIDKEMRPLLQKLMAMKSFLFKQAKNKHQINFIKQELWPKLQSAYQLIQSYK